MSEEEEEEEGEKVFFLEPPQADLSDLQQGPWGLQPPYCRPETEFPAITEQEIMDAIARVPADKAPGEDGIPNRVWKVLAAYYRDTFVPALSAIFGACM